jgi:hypothetical protein
MSPNAAGFLAAELRKALDAGAGGYWLINCGSVKPHVHMLTMAGEMWRGGGVEVNEWRKRYAAAYYGGEKAEAIAALFEEYASCAAQYGPHEDDRAGEQIWHHPVRELLCRWIAGDTANCLESLIWLTGNAPFGEQVKTLRAISAGALPGWEAFCKKGEELLPALNADSRRLFEDTLLLHGRLQRYGAAGASAFCESFRAFASGGVVQAFSLASRSLAQYRSAAAALTEAEHGAWAGYYNGDCLTDVRLTVSCLEALAAYLRVVGDGPDFHTWENNFLIPESERKVRLLSSKRRALSCEELAGALEVSGG